MDSWVVDGAGVPVGSDVIEDAGVTVSSDVPEGVIVISFVDV